jgi:predicted small metal-binding protein
MPWSRPLHLDRRHPIGEYRHDRREVEMAYTINCECGYVVRADSEDELVANAEAHIQDAHPDMVGKVGREDLLAMAEES